MLSPQKIDGFLGPGYFKEWTKLGRLADAQLKKAKAQSGRIPAQYRDEYRADAGEIGRVRRRLEDELKAVQAGKAKKPEPIRKLFDEYSLRVSWVEKLNEKWEVVIASQVAGMVASLAALSVKWIKGMPGQMAGCVTEFGKLQRELVLAGKDLGDAHAQRAVNVLITVLASFLGPAGALGKAVAALGVGLAQFSLDAALGVDKPKAASDAGNAATAIGAAASAADKTGRVLPKFVSAAAAVVTLKTDTDEIRVAEKRFAALQTRLKQTTERFQRLHQTLQKELPNLKKHERTLVRIEQAMKKLGAKVRQLDAEAAAIKRKMRSG